MAIGVAGRHTVARRRRFGDRDPSDSWISAQNDERLWDRGIIPDQYVMGMPQRRPDLLALREGYQSQEARPYKAVLGQFPALSIGVNYAVGTEQTHAVGWQATLTLPFSTAIAAI